MIMIGILASVAVPKFMGSSDFDAMGFARQTQQTLRLAQKTAIAKRRTVCVAIASNILTLRFASAYGVSTCDTPLRNTATNANFSQTAPSGLSIADVSFTYDSLGRPSFSSTQVLTVVGASVAQTITVEAETGYVH